MPAAEAPVEMSHCMRCKDHAHFIHDETEGWVSECCGWPAIPVDIEPPEAA